VLRRKTPDRSRWGDRKLDYVRPQLQRAEGPIRVVALIVAEEFQYVWSARNPGSQARAGVHRVRPPSAGECAPATSILTIRSSVSGSSNVAVTDAAARQPTNRESRATVLLLVDAAATRSDALV